MANKNPKTEQIAKYKFQPGDNAGPGRPMRLDTKIGKQMTDEERKVSITLNKGDIPALCGLLLGSSESFLRRAVKEEGFPMLVRIYSQGLLNDLATGEPNTTEKMINRICGTPKTINEHTGADGEPLNFLPQPFSREEVRFYLERIRERG